MGVGGLLRMSKVALCCQLLESNTQTETLAGCAELFWRKYYGSGTGEGHGKGSRDRASWSSRGDRALCNSQARWAELVLEQDKQKADPVSDLPCYTGDSPEALRLRSPG